MHPFSHTHRSKWALHEYIPLSQSADTTQSLVRAGGNMYGIKKGYQKSTKSAARKVAASFDQHRAPQFELLYCPT